MEAAQSEETELEIAERQVREAESLFGRQREVVAEYRRGGVTVARAERLLATFEASLAKKRERLANFRDGTSSN
jgi:hypothetical protein